MALARLFSSALTRIAMVAASLVALAAIGAEAQPRPQQPGWSLCNETSYVLEAALGRPDGRAITVQGWTRLRPGECRVAVSAPLARGTHYLYARTSDAHRGGRRQWGGDATLCVDPQRNFTHENPPQCSAMGLAAQRFRRVRVNRRDSWRTTFAEAQPYTLSRARAMGLQRLLSDAGYELPAGRSGVDPRVVGSAIAQFRASARLAPNTSDSGLIDALVTAARRRSGQLGLTLCNRTQARLWTAIGWRRGEGWESRGWWPLGPGGCVRTIDESLFQESYFVFAAMESPDGDRFLAAGGEAFCTSPARFAILNRERCNARYYDTNYFTRIAAQGRTGLVVDFFPRDFLPPGERPQTQQAASQADAGGAAPDSGRRGGLAPLSAGDPAPPPRQLPPEQQRRAGSPGPGAAAPAEDAAP